MTIARAAFPWHRPLRAALSAALSGLAAVAPAREVPCPPAAAQRIERPTAADGRLSVGWTHERWSPDKLPDSAAKAADELLREAAGVQNTQIMGWGLPSPLPSPDQPDFKALDQRVDLMKRTARWPVLTLCCAPDWMKGGRAGETDWSRLAAAPLPEHFDDFARLAATVAQRYPEVRHFLVWNELKGFWNPSSNRWDAVGYTTLYNKVYRAIKAVRPDALVGGPYVVMSSFRTDDALVSRHGSELSGAWGTVDRRALDVVQYWLANKVGADFVAVDGGVMPTKGALQTDSAAALGKFAAVNGWLKRRTDLPIWWAEFYPVPPTMSGDEAVAQLSRSLEVSERSGASVVLFWNPACRSDVDYGSAACLWSSGTDTAIAPSAFARTLARAPGGAVAASSSQGCATDVQK
mgnify:CR=1 FL=1